MLEPDGPNMLFPVKLLLVCPILRMAVPNNDIIVALLACDLLDG